MSLSLLISYRGFKFFVGGDIEQLTEAKIAARDLVMDVDLYQANHHGSHSSSSPAFMADLKPTLVVISNGSVQRYKHPRAVTLNTYASTPGPPIVLQTNKCFHPSPCANVADAFIADREAGEDDGTILVDVQPSSGNFTASYGSTKRTFAIKAPAAPITTTATVVIESLLPNPIGPDEQMEEITIRNKKAQAISLQGWILRDRSGLDWHLAGTIPAGQSRTLRRNQQAMSLNNAGDEIVLIDGAQTERDRFSYTSSTEGTIIKTLH